jgi:predicted ester cyclase
MTVSLESTKRTMTAYMDALINGGDFAQYLAPNILWTTMETGDTMTGRETVRDFIVTLHTRIFDAHPELVHLAIDDGVAAAEVIFVGTHAAEFAGVQPTGTSVRLPYTVFYDVTDEGITELRLYLSIRALVDQISVPQAAPAAAGD